MNKLIAIIDDEADITGLVALHLEKAGFDAREFNEPEAFFRFLKKQMPALIILDLMLPGTDGLEICKALKRDAKFAHVPIIMLTAKADETDKILGLELGADDYVTKPFSPKELVARVKVVLRRQGKPEPETVAGRESIKLDREKFEVTVEGKRIDLTTTEYKILDLLMSGKGVVFSREKILDAVWGENVVVIDRTVDVHIKHLREKLGKTGQRIKNIRGVGYKCS